MGEGHEYLHQIHDALAEFEEAIVRRQKRKLIEAQVPLQQQVDNARQKVVDVVVKLVTAERMKQQSPGA